MNGGLQHSYRFIIDPQRHGEGMPVLSPVRERKSRRVGEAIRGSMHDLGDHSQSPHGPGAHSGSEQQVREVRRSAIGRRGQIAIEPSVHYIAGANIVMCRQIEMWKEWSPQRVRLHRKRLFSTARERCRPGPARRGARAACAETFPRGGRSGSRFRLAPDLRSRHAARRRNSSIPRRASGIGGPV